MGHWALGIGHGALGIGHWAWGMGHGALGIGHWVLGMGELGMGELGILPYKKQQASKMLALRVYGEITSEQDARTTGIW
ncbi:hypothetical protein [Rivularia sp. UHCC 0363]|uniref:hypothetical protein n=1 Tax=Rivularia sp. UHCC 0363 TaxID=3110244 RepID=UPI002B1FE791|nr:hypothetical protein [Rivularia sp. UHCC 0363]MEA5598861.1 hypothetical protein [Rivularia sp. UHCC 0363]